MKKNKPMKTLAIILAFQSIIGCNNDDTPPPLESNLSNIVWRVNISQNASSGLNCAPIVYNNTAIVGKPKNNGYKVMAFNDKTGKEVWSVLLPESNNMNPIDTETAFLSRDKLIYSDALRTYVLNAHNGDLIWYKKRDKLRGGTCLIDNYLYKSKYVKRSHSTLYRYDLETGAEEELFTLRQGVDEPGGDFSPNICLPVKWTSSNGDEVLIMQNRSYGFDRIGPDGMYGHSKMDVFAYNLTADSILWYRYELDGFSSMSRPAIDGDQVYFYGDHHAYSIDAKTGETNWKFFIGDGPEDDFNTANILVLDNFLVVKPDNDHMHVVQKDNGKLVWTNKETESMPGMITHRNDTLWFASARIYGIDLYSGAKVVQWDDGRWGDWIFPIAPHPTLPYIYTTDGDYVYCLDPRNM